MTSKKKLVMAEPDVISLKFHEVLILDKRSLARGHLFVLKVLTIVEKPSKKKIVQHNVKGKMADTYSYISVTFSVHFCLCLWTEF